MALDISAINPGANIQAYTAASRNIHRETTNIVSQPDSEQPIEDTIRELELVSRAFNRRLSFKLNDKIDAIVVKVIDTQSDKVIREIPPQELQNVRARIRDVLGILFDERT